MYYKLFAPRTFVSLIIALAYIQKRRGQNILLLNTNSIKKKLIVKMKPYLSKYFLEIHFFKYDEYKSSGGLISRHFYIYKFIKKKLSNKVLKKIAEKKISHIYGGGNFLEEIFSIILKKKPRFYFLEHGIGNILNFTEENKIFRSSYYLCLRLLKIKYFSPVKFIKYIGLFCGPVRKKIYINGSETPAYTIKNFRRILMDLKSFVKIREKIKNGNKNNLVFLNINNLKMNKTNDFNDLIERMLKLITNNETILVKEHPNNLNYHKTFKFFKKILKKNNNKLIILDRYYEKNLPIEVFIEKFKIKKIISLISAVPLYSSILFKNVENHIFINYSIKYPVKKGINEFSIKNKKFYIESFPKIAYH